MSSITPPAKPSPKIYDADTYGVDNSVGLLMRRVLQSIVQQADARLAVHGLTNAQWKPLLRLHLKGACSPAEMARDLQMDAGAVTRLLDRLERKGLCARERSSQDRRAVNVMLTAQGRRSVKPVPGVMSDVLNAHLSDFSYAEWQLVMQLLRRMLNNGEAARNAEQDALGAASAQRRRP